MEKRLINGVELKIGPKASLSGANLSGANLSRANLSGASLSGASLFWANLSKADLSGANLSKADLSWANLSGANLSGADLSGAWFFWANLSSADLSGANLSWANLSRAKGIISFGPVGEEGRIGYVVANEETGPMVHLGCFWGTVEEARTAIRKKYGENSTYEEIMVACAKQVT